MYIDFLLGPFSRIQERAIGSGGYYGHLVYAHFTSSIEAKMVGQAWWLFTKVDDSLQDFVATDCIFLFTLSRQNIQSHAPYDYYLPVTTFITSTIILVRTL